MIDLRCGDCLELMKDIPDGSIKAVHCGWISTIQDDWQENKLLNNLGDDDCKL